MFNSVRATTNAINASRRAYSTIVAASSSMRKA
jgi:hypothetical protein